MYARHLAPHLAGSEDETNALHHLISDRYCNHYTTPLFTALPITVPGPRYCLGVCGMNERKSFRYRYGKSVLHGPQTLWAQGMLLYIFDLVLHQTISINTGQSSLNSGCSVGVWRWRKDCYPRSTQNFPEPVPSQIKVNPFRLLLLCAHTC